MRLNAIVVFFLFVLAFQTSLGWVHAYSGAKISAPLLKNPVTVDAKFTTPDEWSDAAVVDFQKANPDLNSEAILYIKHTADTFYWLIDFVSSTKMVESQDGGGCAIDPGHDGGTGAQPDDVRFDAWAGGVYRTGTGTTFGSNKPLPAGVEIAEALSASPNLATPHIIGEFKVPFSVIPPMAGDTVGFSCSAYTKQGIAADSLLTTWPPGRLFGVPNSWGELTLSPTPVPEFDLVPIMITLTVLSALAIVKVHTRRGKTVT